jgi:hypothetical protein
MNGSSHDALSILGVKFANGVPPLRSPEVSPRGGHHSHQSREDQEQRRSEAEHEPGGEY